MVPVRSGRTVGVTRQTIISIEKGRLDPSLGLAFKLAGVFGCRIEDIFSPIEQPIRSLTFS
jgi:putative transcriptional regulator